MAFLVGQEDVEAVAVQEDVAVDERCVPEVHAVVEKPEFLDVLEVVPCLPLPEMRSVAGRPEFGTAAEPEEHVVVVLEDLEDEQEDVAVVSSPEVVDRSRVLLDEP